MNLMRVTLLNAEIFRVRERYQVTAPVSATSHASSDKPSENLGLGTIAITPPLGIHRNGKPTVQPEHPEVDRQPSRSVVERVL
jgi:hypothetical protein